MPFIWGALIGAAGSALSANSAAGAQQGATDAAIGEQSRQYDTTRSDFAPYREAGQKALGQLATENDQPLSADSVTSDPGYQFGLDQGQLGLDRKAAASGGRVSGAALKAASQYATNYATTGYGAAYQRRQDRLNRLAALAGIGQTSTAGSAAAGSASTNAISGLLSRQGDATAANRLAQGNIWGNAGNQIASMYGRQNRDSSIGYNPAQVQNSNTMNSLYGPEGYG